MAQEKVYFKIKRHRRNAPYKNQEVGIMYAQAALKKNAL